MMTNPNFLKVLAVSFGLALLSAAPAHALLTAHSEVHVSNLQVTPNGGSLSWIYSPGLNIAGHDHRFGHRLVGSAHPTNPSC